MTETDEPQSNDTTRDLQGEKLLLEIGRLRRPFWQSSGALGVLAATILAIGTLLTGYFTGFFDVESRRLGFERTVLTRDVDEFRERKRVLEDSLSCLDSLFDVVQDSVITLVDARDSLLVTHEEQTDSLETREIELTELRSDLLGIEETKRALEVSLGQLTDSIVGTQALVSQLIEARDSLLKVHYSRVIRDSLQIKQMEDSVQHFKQLAEGSGLTAAEQSEYQKFLSAYRDTLLRLRIEDSLYYEWSMRERVRSATYLMIDHIYYENGMPIVFPSSAISTFGAGQINGTNFGDSIGALYVSAVGRSGLGETVSGGGFRVSPHSILTWSDHEIRVNLSSSEDQSLNNAFQSIDGESLTVGRPFYEWYLEIEVETADGRQSRSHQALYGEFWYPW